MLPRIGAKMSRLPLVAGSSVGHEPCLLHIGWDTNQVFFRKDVMISYILV